MLLHFSQDLDCFDAFPGFRKPYNPEGDTKEEEEYIRDVEVAVGVNLRGKIKGGKRKRQDDANPNPSAAVRKRLSVRRF